MKKTAAALAFAFLSIIVLMSAKKKEEAYPVPKAYILIESRTGTVLEEHNSHERLNAGYLTKLMALLIIADDIDSGGYSLDDEITASEAVTGTKGSVVWLEAGDKMTVEELLKSVIIGNANDALLVLAERSAGSIEDFTARMNEKASAMGLDDTFFCSPFGFFNENEHTSAYDIAMICRELYGFDFLDGYFKTWRDFVRGESVELVSENTLSRTYKLHAGFKAAHSDEAGYCIAEFGENESGTAFISVILGADSEETSFGMAKQLIGKGFGDYKVSDSLFPNDLMQPVRVKNGEASAVELVIEGQGDIVVPRWVNKLRYVSIVPNYLTAPVKKGDRVGSAALYNGKELVFEADIAAKNDVEKLTFGYVFKKVLSNIIE